MQSISALAAFALILQIAPTGAQSTGAEAHKKEIARGKEIVERLKTGKTISKEEVEVLEGLVAQLELVTSRGDGPVGAPSTVGSVPPGNGDSKPRSR